MQQRACEDIGGSVVAESDANTKTSRCASDRMDNKASVFTSSEANKIEPIRMSPTNGRTGQGRTGDRAGVAGPKMLASTEDAAAPM